MADFYAMIDSIAKNVATRDMMTKAWINDPVIPEHIRQATREVLKTMIRRDEAWLAVVDATNVSDMEEGCARGEALQREVDALLATHSNLVDEWLNKRG